MPRHIYSFVIGILMLSLLSASVSAQEKVLQTSICSIKTEPEIYLGKDVEVDAVMYSGFEMAWLEDLNVCATPREYRFDYRYGEGYERRTPSKVRRHIEKILSRRIVKPTGINKYRGTFNLRLTKYEKKNDFDTRFDYVIEILKVDSVVEVKSTRSKK